MNRFSKLAETVKSPKFSSGAICAAVIALIMVANMILYVLGTTFGWYLYSPEELDLSVSGSTDAVFNKAQDEVRNGIQGKITISFCMTKEDLSQHSKGSLVMKTAENLAARYPELIELDFINIITRRNKENKPVSLEQYKKNPDGTENSILKTSVIFECENRFKVVNDYASADGYSTFYTLTSDLSVTSYNGEEILTSMAMWVMREEHPTAYFTTGHGESSSTSLTTMFACAGYDLKTINVRDQGIPTDNPDNVLVISNPVADFEKGGPGVLAELDRLEDYVSKGGHIYVAIDPYVEPKSILNLAGFLKKYGIGISSTVNENGVTLRNIVKDSRNAVTTDGYTVVTEFAENAQAAAIRDKVASYGTAKVLVREAAALKCSGSAYELLVTSPSSVCEVGGSVTDSEGGYCVAAAAPADSGTLFVISSAYLTSDDIMATDGYSNKDFVYAVTEDIFGQDTPPYGCTGIPYDAQTLEGLTMGTARVYTVIACVIPALIAVAGVIVITKRRNG